jgi:hypothetical protein
LVPIGLIVSSFESREICEDVIRDFNNHPVKKQGEDEEYQIQIRYSDTQEQKHLKQTTALARQFRAQEFEYGVMQARQRLMAEPPFVTAASTPLYPSANQNEFEQYMTTNTA